MTFTLPADSNLQVLRINDFSPGIVLYGRGNLGTMTSPFAATGSAMDAHRCINQPGIGLIPLPRWQLMETVGPGGTPYTPNFLPLIVTGLRTIGPVAGPGTQPQVTSQTAPDMVYICLNYQNDGAPPNSGHRQTELIRYDEALGTGHRTLLQTTVPDIFPTICHGASLSNTRIQWTDGSGNVWAVNCTAFVDVGSGYLYYTPTSTSAPGDTNISTNHTPTATITRYKAAFCHEFRTVIFCEIRTQFGTETYLGLPMGTETFEDIIYTDPPESTTMVNYTTPGAPVPHFDPEDMSSFGAWGSINSGELMLVRQGRGGVILNGDLTSPDVTKLPGVVGTGIIAQQGVNTPDGMIYLSDNDGAYSWNGSNTANKISRQIPDDALHRAAVNNFWIAGENAHNDIWQSWACFANNWLYDTIQNSWWKIEDPAVINFELWARGSYTRHIWACEGYSTGPPWTVRLCLFDKRNPVSSYGWTSNPITSPGTYVNIEWLEILATNTDVYNAASFTITATSLGGRDSAPETFTIPTNSQGKRLHRRVGWFGDSLQLVVAAQNAGNGPAPTLHEIVLGLDTKGTPPVGRTG